MGRDAWVSRQTGQPAIHVFDDRRPWCAFDEGAKILDVFWPQLSSSEQAMIERIAVRRVYGPGEKLFGNNDSGTAVIVLLNGQVKLTRNSTTGRSIVIELRGSGDLIGELAALDATPRIATGIAATSVVALIVPATRFRQLLLEQPRICFAVLMGVAAKLRQATEWRAVTSSTDASTRLAGRLVELVGNREPDLDGVIEIKSPLTQQELADWIGVSRDAVVLALGSMRAQGWIETGRRTIRILDLPALRSAGKSATPIGPSGGQR